MGISDSNLQKKGCVITFQEECIIAHRCSHQLPPSRPHQTGRCHFYAQKIAPHIRRSQSLRSKDDVSPWTANSDLAGIHSCVNYHRYSDGDCLIGRDFLSNYLRCCRNHGFYNSILSRSGKLDKEGEPDHEKCTEGL